MVEWLFNLATFNHRLGDLRSVIRARKGWKNKFPRDPPGPQVEFIAHKNFVQSGSRFIVPGSRCYSSECYKREKWRKNAQASPVTDQVPAAKEANATKGKNSAKCASITSD
ncbi:hypothetical protein DPMN_073029 [Dreissena polymorpha]|uniref:Uncharacterized protein n=1 Tax=Dreissena polymorpha TaxID=45954 RepID=A0A9D4BYF1_DREPO|nr:hypothetical protein DPMN_073029 [Dreissena polymorpha]